jgi:hypothetical protein
MSAVIKTLTPFTEQDVLIEALEELGVSTQVYDKVLNVSHGGGLFDGDILTDRSDYYGVQHFRLINGVYQLRHDSSEMNGRVIDRSLAKGYTKVSQFLNHLESEYKKSYQRKLERVAEEERQRLERERLALIEVRRKSAIEKAEAQGYRVKEQRKNGKIQLVLTRTVY